MDIVLIILAIVISLFLVFLAPITAVHKSNEEQHREDEEQAGYLREWKDERSKNRRTHTTDEKE